jgi:hypothetical protein
MSSAMEMGKYEFSTYPPTILSPLEVIANYRIGRPECTQHITLKWA